MLGPGTAAAFSTRVEPWATTVCWSSGDRIDAGAYPCDFVFAFGTFVSETEAASEIAA